jgi:hypothetical protein
LHGAELPNEVIEWCLEQAKAAQNEVLRRNLFDKAAVSLLRRLDFTPALLDELLSIKVRHPSLQANVDSWLVAEPEEWRREQAIRKAEHAVAEQTRIREWRDLFRKHQKVIEAGTAPAKLMNDLAMIYYGRYREGKGDTPIERLQAFFGDDSAITHASLAGLRRTLDRDDLPAVAEIADLAAKGRHHYIAEAGLAGVEELGREGMDAILNLHADVKSRLVAFRLSHDFDDTPSWFLALVKKCPEIVADVQIAYGTAMFKARKEHVSGLYPLARDGDYAEVARRAALPLLGAYPLRWKRDSLNDLATLLVAAIKHGDRHELLQRIETRLSRPSLEAAQRSQWLSAGLLLDPDRYEQPLSRYVGTNQARALLVAGFFEPRSTRAQNLPELSESAITLLIRLLAPHCSPERSRGAGLVTREMNAADFVRSLISGLGAKPTASASAAFDTLLAIGSLRDWHGELRHRQEDQRVVSREAHFRRPAATAVVKILANAEPASAADLRELLMQHLRDMAQDDRNGNTTGYHRYWHPGSNGRPPIAPYLENTCRDRLYDVLKERLRPTGIDMHPEAECRDNKRTDIKASFGGIKGFTVPIEIKCESNPDMWSALHKQLINEYSREPQADGQGIYLVFWFGGLKMPTAADGGPPPRGAAELETRLLALLSDEEQSRISVIVMDCALPATA